VVPVDWQDLLTHEKEEETTSCTECDIMQLEEESKLEGLTSALELSETKNGDQVYSEGSEDWRQCREWCLSSFVMYEVRGKCW